MFMLFNDRMPEGDLLALAQVGIACIEEAADDLFLALDAEITDHFEAVLRLHDLLYTFEGSGICPHQGIEGAD